MNPEQQAINCLQPIDVTNIELRFVVRHEAAYDMPEDGCTREVQRLQWRRLHITYYADCGNVWKCKTYLNEWTDVPIVTAA